MLTESQKQTLRAAILAETAPEVMVALAIRNDVALAEWYNQPVVPAQLAWRKAMSSRDLFEATDVASFDNLTAGKRDAWKLLLEFAPLDMGRSKLRKAVTDIWSAAQANLVLAECTEPLLRIEAVFGGTAKTSGSVTAMDRTYIGPIDFNDISSALNMVV